MNKIFQENLVEKVGPIVKEAGLLLLSYLGKVDDVERKNDRSIVTEADRVSEAFLIDKLRPIVSGAGFLAEESVSKEPSEKREFMWVIDPLDGTTNFSHGFPYFSISIGLTRNETPIFGVVYNPILDELFYAEQGKGAFLNGKKIQVAQRDVIDRLVVSIGVPVPCPIFDFEKFWHRFEQIQCRVHSFRKLGSAALDLAYVACGRLDGSFFGRLSWWDIAAGIVLVREAGGHIAQFDTDDIGPGFATCLASNKQMFEELRNLVHQKGDN